MLPNYFVKLLRQLILEKEKLIGGEADNIDPSDFDQKELMKGIYIEFEHTNDVKTAMEICMDHLISDPLYYQKLEKMEKRE